MDTSSALDALGALSQETRLNIFRLLVKHAPDGLPVGTIARQLHLPGPTLSFHLNVLAAADLVQPHKNGRSISYSPNLDSVNDLAGFLMDNCCGGRQQCSQSTRAPEQFATLRQIQERLKKKPKRR
jgi:ArsR family transcriptional regulator